LRSEQQVVVSVTALTTLVGSEYTQKIGIARAEGQQNLTIQAGNSGLIVGTPSDPRMAGMTLRVTF
jgi:hypothetical protein